MKTIFAFAFIVLTILNAGADDCVDYKDLGEFGQTTQEMYEQLKAKELEDRHNLCTLAVLWPVDDHANKRILTSSLLKKGYKIVDNTSQAGYYLAYEKHNNSFIVVLADPGGGRQRIWQDTLGRSLELLNPCGVWQSDLDDVNVPDLAK